MSAIKETDTFTFEMLILSVKSVISLNENDNSKVYVIVLFVSSKRKYLWDSFVQVTLVAATER